MPEPVHAPPAPFVPSPVLPPPVSPPPLHLNKHRATRDPRGEHEDVPPLPPPDKNNIEAGQRPVQGGREDGSGAADHWARESEGGAAAGSESSTAPGRAGSGGHRQGGGQHAGPGGGWGPGGAGLGGGGRRESCELMPDSYESRPDPERRPGASGRRGGCSSEERVRQQGPERGRTRRKQARARGRAVGGTASGARERETGSSAKPFSTKEKEFRANDNGGGQGGGGAAEGKRTPDTAGGTGASRSSSGSTAAAAAGGRRRAGRETSGASGARDLRTASEGSAEDGRDGEETKGDHGSNGAAGGGTGSTAASGADDDEQALETVAETGRNQAATELYDNRRRAEEAEARVQREGGAQGGRRANRIIAQHKKRNVQPCSSSTPALSIGMWRREMHAESAPAACRALEKQYDDVLLSNFVSDVLSDKLMAELWEQEQGGSASGVSANFPGRLPAAVDVWRCLGAPQGVIDELKAAGVQIEWESNERPCTPPGGTENHIGAVGSPSNDFVVQAVQELVDGGVLEEEDKEAGIYVKFTAPLFTVPKGEDGFRLIWDGRTLNKFVKPHKFSMPTLHRWRHNFKCGVNESYLMSADLTSAFSHIPLLPADREYSGLVLNGKKYRYKSLCFGQQFAPVTFCRYTAVLSKWLNNGCQLDEDVLQELETGTDKQRATARMVREKLTWAGGRIPAILYMDDLLITRLCGKSTDDTNKDANAVARLLVNVTSMLGWSLNRKKSLLKPHTRVEFLGIEVDVRSGRFVLPERRRTKVLAKVQGMIGTLESIFPRHKLDISARGESWRPPQRRQGERGGIDDDLKAYQEEGKRIAVRGVASLAGSLMSTRLCVGRLAPTFTRSFFHSIRDRVHSQNCVSQGGRCTSACWKGKAVTRADMLRDCYLWEHVLSSPMRGMPIHSTAGDGVEVTRHVHAACDASNRALGGVIDGQERGLYMPMTQEERDESSMVRELAGIDVLLAAFETDDGVAEQTKHTDDEGGATTTTSATSSGAPGEGLPPGSVIFLRTDSLCSDMVLKRGGSGNVNGDALVAAIYIRCLRRGWRLETQWVPREDNQVADDRSKDVDSGDFCISPGALRDVCRRFAITPSFDIFASAWSRIATNIPYCSRWFMAESCGDAWHRSWSVDSVGASAWLFAPPNQLNDVMAKIERDGFSGVIVVPRNSNAWWRQELDGWIRDARTTGRIKSAGITMTAANGAILASTGDAPRLPDGAFQAFLIDRSRPTSQRPRAGAHRQVP